jgi:hypothetical protein
VWLVAKPLLWNVSLAKHWFSVPRPSLSPSSTQLFVSGASCILPETFYGAQIKRL